MSIMFSRRTARSRAGEVKGWITKHLNLSDEDIVTVAELTCVEPGCPPIETVVTVHGEDGVRRSWHIHQPLSQIDEALVVASISKT